MIDFLSKILAHFNLIVVPVYCFYRIRKNSYISLINPCFYLLIFAYLYLTVSSFFLEGYLQYRKLLEPWYKTFNIDSVETTNLLCNWFTFVFFLFYIFSVDKKIIAVPFSPKKITYNIALILGSICTIAFIVVLVLKGAELTAISHKGRVQLLEFYAGEIIGKYKIDYFQYILLGCVAVMVWHTQNFLWYLLLLPPITLEILSQGRDSSFFILVFAYVNYLAITKKPHLLIISFLMIGLISTSILRLGENLRFESFQHLLYYLLVEIFETRITTIVAYEHFMNYGDLANLLLFSILKFMPTVIVNIWAETPKIYIFIMQDFYITKLNNRMGLAGNIVSEALFYGGISFAIISPLIVGSIFYGFNRFKIYKTFPGFIYLCFVIARLRGFLRNGFYDLFLSLVWLMLSYLIWITILEWNSVVFKSIKKYRSTSRD